MTGLKPHFVSISSITSPVSRDVSNLKRATLVSITAIYQCIADFAYILLLQLVAIFRQKNINPYSISY
jgi:hypothetical protein